MPDWVFPTLWVIVLFSIICGFAWRKYQRQLRAISKRRPNPSKAEFLDMMRDDVSDEASEFLWKTVLFYIEPHATPHPEDDLIRELPIDPDDIHLDWPSDWAERQSFDESNLPDWPEEWPVTVRNFGRWLDMGPERSVF